MAITDAPWDKVRDAWEASIPLAYKPKPKPKTPSKNKFTGKDRGAIILPMPPDATLER